MIDIDQTFGGDLAASQTGDLATADGTSAGTQRVLRRLLTNPGDYLFHPSYGAGLPARVGTLADAAGIRALIRGQMLLEPAVARSPEPVVVVTDITGGIAVAIKYTDAASGAAAALSFDVTSE